MGSFETNDTQVQKEKQSQDQQKALRRTRRLLAAVLCVLLVVLAVSGWREWQHRKTLAGLQQQTSSEKTSVSWEKEILRADKEALLSVVSGQFERFQQAINQGLTNTQTIQDLLNNEYLPKWEKTLETEIATLYEEVEAVEGRLQQEAIAREIERLANIMEDTRGRSASYQPDRGTLYSEAQSELLNAFRNAWENGATLVQKESQKKLIEFRRDHLKPLENEASDTSEEHSLPDMLTRELYHVYLSIESLPVTLDAVDDYDPSQPSDYTDPNITIPIYFKDGEIPWEIDNLLYNLETKVQSLDQQFQNTINTLYEAGRYTERKYVEDALESKDQELGPLYHELNQLQDTLATYRNEQQNALETLKTHQNSAFIAYEQAGMVFEVIQGFVEAFVALDNAYQQGHYEEAIRAAIRVCAYSPEMFSPYVTLIQSLGQLRAQNKLSRSFLDEVFHETISISDKLFADGTVESLRREHRTYLSRVYYEFSICFTELQDYESALSANAQALKIAELVDNNEANIDRLRRQQETLKSK